MNEEQARALVADAFKQLDLSETILKRSDTALYRALVVITRRIGQLPPEGDLMREVVWKKLQRDLLPELNLYAKRLGVEVLTTLKAELVNIERFAASYIEVPLEINGRTTLGQEVSAQTQVNVGGFSSGATADPNVRKIENPFNFTAQVAGESVTVRSGNLAYKALSQVEVAGTNVRNLLGVGISEAGELIPLKKGNPSFGSFLLKSVDKHVRLGILRGDTTEALARSLVSDSIRGKLVMGATGKQLRSAAMTVARTAVADTTERVHEAFWDANSDRIAAWSYEGSMDGRICEQCLPWDGVIKKDRDDLPVVPQHPRCRCRRIPETRTSLALRKGDQKDNPNAGTSIEYFNEAQLSAKFGRKNGEDFDGFLKRVSGPRERGEGVGDDSRWRVFKTPQKGPDGERWFRASHDLRLNNGRPVNAAEWLGQAEPATQQQFFGSGSSKAGAVRAEIFRRKVASGRSPQQALNELLSGDRMQGRQFIPLSKLKGELPEAERILSPREEALLARRKAQARKRSSAKAKP